MSNPAYGVICYKLMGEEAGSDAQVVVTELVRVLQSVGGELTTLEEVRRRYLQEYTGEAEHLDADSTVL